MARTESRRWIVLDGGGPAIDLTSAIDRDDLLVIDDPEPFCALLETTRPKVAVLAVPPAAPDHEVRALATRRRRPGLQLIHVTRPEDVERRIAALRRGFDDAVPATIDPRELVDRVRILDERGRGRRGRPVHVALDVVLDPIAHEVRRDGRRVHLRPKEYQLLATLAAHPGRAYTRRQLLDRVWGQDHVGDPRTVDVHVRWLRAKIEPAPDAPAHLVTVRGVGYRLDPDPR